jgi:WD40 repeat protein
MMRGVGERKYWILHTVLAITIIIGFVFASGCSNLSLGSTQVADFGNSKDSEQVQNCFINKYGNPATYSGPPRFIEPMVSDGIVNNTPANKVSKFSRDTPSVYIWAFYEGFKPGDQVSAVWTFNGQQFASLSKKIGGNYGIAYGQFDKPKSGWAVGTHTITISGNGVQGSATFDIIDGATVTEPLPCKLAGGQEQGTPVTTPPLAVSLVTTIQTPVKALWTQPRVLVGSTGNQLPKANSILKLLNADEMEMSGDIIVWTDGRNFDDTLEDIYMYNIATKQESPLIVVNNRQKSPAISGNLIAYANWTDGKKIHVYDLNTRKDTTIPTVHRAETVDIDGKQVVFEDFNTQSIVLYDISTGKDTLVMAGGEWPRISGDNIIYWKSVNNRDDIYLYNIPNKKETCITCGLTEKPTADYRIDGNYVVFDMSTAGEPLRLYNIGTKTTSTIVPCPGKCDYQTRGIGGAWYDISGNNVVYVSSVDCDDCGIEDGVFIYDIPAGTTKALHLHSEADYDSGEGSLGPPNGGYPRISGNNVIFWQGFEDIYLIKL